jgi:hypothetical protein
MNKIYYMKAVTLSDLPLCNRDVIKEETPWVLLTTRIPALKVYTPKIRPCGSSLSSFHIEQARRIYSVLYTTDVINCDSLR